MTEILRYTAFATEPSGGNPAGVVPDATGLSDSRMLEIAAVLGYSETAFLTPEPGDRAYRLRFFSPQAEVSFCGHATVAAAVLLGDRFGTGEFRFTTQNGPVPVRVEDTARGRRATLTSVPPRFAEIAEGDVSEALDILGWRQSELDGRLPPRFAFAGAWHLILAAATSERLATLDYDFDRLREFMLARDLTTLQLVWPESDQVYRVRNPFPVGGVVEDPATGAAAAAFGAYLREISAVRAPARLLLRQGEEIGRPGMLEVDISPAEEGIRVSGHAVPLPGIHSSDPLGT